MIKQFFKDGKINFEGEYKNGERNGKGKQYKENFKPKHHSLLYEGEFLNGKYHGQGKLYHIGPCIYEGEFFNGHLLNGKAKWHTMRGEDFEGEYLNGKISKGKIIKNMIMVGKFGLKENIKMV